MIGVEKSRENANVRQPAAFARGVLLNVAILLTTVLVLFATLEIGLRIFLPQFLDLSLFNETLGHVNPKNISVVDRSPQLFTNEYEVRNSINSKGFYDRERTYSNDASTFRILILGDSFAAGATVGMNETFYRLLEDRLNNDGRGAYEVISNGVGSYSFDKYYVQFKEEGIKYDPDMVVIAAFLGNDIDYQELFDIVNGTLVQKKLPLPSTQLRARKWLRGHSHAYIFLVKILASNGVTHEALFRLGFFVPSKQDIFGVISEDEYAVNLKKVDLILKEFKEYARMHKIPLVLALVPVKEQVDDRKYAEYYERRQIEPTIRRFRPQEDLLIIAKNYDIPAIDFLPDFRRQNKNNTFYYEVDGHWNKEGHRLAAELLYRKLVPLIHQ